MRSRYPLYICLFALFLLASGTAYAFKLAEPNKKPLTLNIENTLGVEWHNEHEFDGGTLIGTDDYLKLTETLTASLDWNGFSLGTRIEGLYYPDQLVKRQSGKDDEQISQDDIRFEKYHFAYDSGKFRLDLGDYYATFGRGLALSMRRSPDGQLDNSLRGAKFEYKSGGTHAAVLAGFSNTVNVDPTSEDPQPDPNDLVMGFRAEQRIIDLFNIGAHAVDTRYGVLHSDSTRRFIPEMETTVLGASLEFPDILGYASFYAEFDHMLRYARKLNEDLDDYATVSDNGRGLYASASFFIENFTLTGEYKLYQDFIFRRGRTKLSYNLEEDAEAPGNLDFYEDIYYNNAPNLERTDIEFGRDYGNDHGFRFRAEYNSMNTGTVPYAVAYYTVNRWQEQGATSLGGFGQFEPGFKGDRIYHLWGGVTQYVGQWEMFVDGGYRDEESRDTGQAIKEVLHLKLGFSGPVAPKHIIGFEGFAIRRDYQILKQLEDDFDLTLSYDLKGAFSLSFFYTMQNLDYLPSNGKDEIKHYFAGEITSRFSDIIEISIFGGQVRESYRCYGGFCRKVPPFEGLKGKVKVRY